MKIEIVPGIERKTGVGFHAIPVGRVFHTGTNTTPYIRLAYGAVRLIPAYQYYESDSFGGADYRVLPEGTQVIITT